MFGNILHREPPEDKRGTKAQSIPQKTPAAESKPASMIPLFSLRSIAVIIIGFIIGIGLGLGYWVFGPSATADELQPEQSGGFLQSLGIGPAPPTEPWRSQVNIQVVNPGSTFVTIAQLSSVGAYYAAKTKSLPFLEFLSLDLAENAPMYNHTVDELDRIIITTIDTTSEQPAILLQVTTPTAEEALFLASRIPEVFEHFLVAEENSQLQQSRDNILKGIEDVKKAIIDAEKQVSNLEAQGIFLIENDPTYVALNTKVTALETELARQANILASMTNQGTAENEANRQQDLEKAQEEIDQLKRDILEAEQKVRLLTEQQSGLDVTNLPSYLKLTAEISALEAQIDSIMNGTINTATGARTIGLAEMITNGTTTGTEYTQAKEKLDTASDALSADKKQLAVLQSQASDEQLQLTLDIQIAQADLDILNARFSTLIQEFSSLASEDSVDNLQAAYDRTSAALSKARQDLATFEAQRVNNQLPGDLDYQVAQSRIVTLNNELMALNDSLSTTFMNTPDPSQTIGSLAAGNPSVPEIVYPERVKARNALAIGAILGILIAWAILNRKWLKKVFTSSESKTESD